jgi:hypothetical protein
MTNGGSKTSSGSRASFNETRGSSLCLCEIDGMGRLKDLALEKGLKFFLKSKLARYGEIQELRIDSSAREIRAVIMLKGETVPLTVSRAVYEVDRKDDTVWLILESVAVSREWIQKLIEDYLVGMRIKVPPLVASVLE